LVARIVGNATGVSFGVRTSTPPVIARSDQWASVEDSAFKLSLKATVLDGIEYDITYKTPSAKRDFSFFAGLPAGFRIGVVNNADVGLFSPDGKQIGGFEVPISISPTGNWSDVSARSVGSSVTFTIAASPNARALQAQAEEEKTASGQVSGKYDTWQHQMGPLGRTVCATNPIDCRRSESARTDAIDRAVAEYPEDKEDTNDNRLDAARHCIWSGLMTERANAEFAEEFAEAHEEDKPGTSAQYRMDTYNNYTGRALGLRYEDRGDELQDVCAGYSHSAVIGPQPP
ncbi:DUF6973 domain-containing protein, partial [Corynebacterium dentalis]|uniref:DUF6973 domain-containing protein n=1 Tax=Corynebacterium dentalis TaxID=2014528 RepID=UPI0035E3E8E0